MIRVVMLIAVCLLATPVVGQDIWQGAQTDQERCQREADYMAARGIRGHVGPVIGRFEGVGYGASSNCSTCQPRGRMVLTGDAVARMQNGMFVRVRSWR